ncbi:MAG TPA: serine/threonine-protein kinase [Gemmataceae bacterium]|jgi:serine/threonine protein kinase
MTIDSAAGLLELLRQLPLLEPQTLKEAESLRATYSEWRVLAQEMIRRGWLTPYQINQLGKGCGATLLLGSYVLLDRLGEGGMGTVFKARHRKMGRIVALKTLRPERLNKPDVLRRFRREIQAAARLSHPNIVLAYDADEANGVHFFTMEYIEGRDLARLVREDGPLDVARACDYVRQAALGLQHAHEQGMVHRDIKPHNLLLNNKGVIKILDLGLARLTPTAEIDATMTGSLTHEGVVMGTPDFMAPEQSLSTRTVDIRADLYALGCTLYFLLAARPPFPGGTLGDKIARHLAEEPQPVEQLRSDVPLAVAAVIRKLMAKKPEDRYATPAETADALHRALKGGASLPSAMTSTNTEMDFALPAAAALPPTASLSSRSARRRWIGALAIVLLLVLSVAAIWPLLAHRLPPTPQPASAAVDPAAAAKSPQPRRTLKGPTAAVRCVAVSPDGKAVAVGDDEGAVRVWNLADGKLLANPKRRHGGAILRLAFASDGTLATGGRDGHILIWQTETFAEERDIALEQKGAVRGLVFPPENPDRILLSVGDNNALLFWEPTAGKIVGGRPLPDDTPPSALTFASKPHSQWAIGLKDGRMVLANDTEADRVVKGHGGAIHAVAFATDGETLATAGDDGFIKLWDVRSGDGRGNLAKDLGVIHGLAISPSGRLLAAVSADSVLRLWHLASHQAAAEVRPEAGELYGVAFTPDGKTLATCGSDRTVQLWDVADLLKPR